MSGELTRQSSPVHRDEAQLRVNEIRAKLNALRARRHASDVHPDVWPALRDARNALDLAATRLLSDE
jgi:hypothetical protein